MELPSCSCKHHMFSMLIEPDQDTPATKRKIDFPYIKTSLLIHLNHVHFFLPPMGKSENDRLLPNISHHAVSIHLECAPTFYTSFGILSCVSDSYRLSSLSPLLLQPVWLPLKLNLISVMNLCWVVRCRFCAKGAAGQVCTNRDLEKMR